MSGDEYLSLLMSLLSTRIPMLAIIIPGLWFARARKAAFPTAARWASRGFLLLLFNSLVSVAIQFLTIGFRPALVGGPEFESFMFWRGMLGLANTLLFFAGFALVARAIFLDREASPRAVS